MESVCLRKGCMTSSPNKCSTAGMQLNTGKYNNLSSRLYCIDWKGSSELRRWQWIWSTLRDGVISVQNLLGPIQSLIFLNCRSWQSYNILKFFLYMQDRATDAYIYRRKDWESTTELKANEAEESIENCCYGTFRTLKAVLLSWTPKVIRTPIMNSFAQVDTHAWRQVLTCSKHREAVQCTNFQLWSRAKVHSPLVCM